VFVRFSQHPPAASAAGLTAEQKTLLRIITGQQHQPLPPRYTSSVTLSHTPADDPIQLVCRFLHATDLQPLWRQMFCCCKSKTVELSFSSSETNWH